ncbi:hypothetical protein MSAN_02057400 [Mycena sanguinolenta]|uniref:O-methyltransferase n=1 Tax=Mycena sanguinolenta TaxID=230812 RepID=A0A8H6XJF8_9AGAR|nr:hypothetical protein MSAN_02057400 [Mycena sanguinolenta]
MGSDGITTLRLLANIINEGIDTIEGVYAQAKMPFPSLDAPFNPTDPAESLTQNTAAEGAVMNIVAAASQLFAAFHVSSCLRVASELNVVELLRDTGPAGLHAEKIAAPSKADPALLARILRLATHNIFREVTPNVFANNRISSALDKGKPSSVLFERRDERLVGTSGLAAFVEYLAEDMFKFSAALGDTILDPKEGVLQFNRALGTDQPFYYWLQRPENRLRMQRFGIGMQGTAATEPPDLIFTGALLVQLGESCSHKIQGFNWSSLTARSSLVDVGGGLGHTSMLIAQKNPSLRVFVQDLKHQVDEAKVASGQYVPDLPFTMVEFQAHDFFNPQPVQNAAVFMLRHIVFNWPDVRAVEILQHLRDAAQPTTKLVVIKKILSVAASAPSSP